MQKKMKSIWQPLETKLKNVQKNGNIHNFSTKADRVRSKQFFFGYLHEKCCYDNESIVSRNQAKKRKRCRKKIQ